MRVSRQNSKRFTLHLSVLQGLAAGWGPIGTLDSNKSRERVRSVQAHFCSFGSCAWVIKIIKSVRYAGCCSVLALRLAMYNFSM
jgi:hypothetical protein